MVYCSLQKIMERIVNLAWATNAPYQSPRTSKTAKGERTDYAGPTRTSNKVNWLFGRMCGWQIKQQPAIAEVFGILSNAQNKAGNSTVSQDSQGIGYASPAVALTVLRPSALG